MVDECKTGAQQAEEALRQSEEKFRLLVNGVKDYAIFMLDPAGRVISWNEGAQRIEGWTAEEIVGQHFSRFYPAESVAAGQPQQELDRTAAQGRYEEEAWRVRKDGSRFWADITITALRDEQGGLRGFAKVTRDITERKRAEEALKSQRQRIVSLLNELPASVCLIAPDHTLFFYNRLFCEIFGEPKGRPCYEVMRGRQEPCENCQTFQVCATKQMQMWEWTTPGNHTLQIYDYPFDDIDGSALVLRMGVDITERKHDEENLRGSEARLAEAQRIAHLGTWDYNIQSGEMIWSEEANRMCGVDKGFVPSREAAMSFIHPEDRARVKEIYERSLAGEAGPYNMVYRIVRPNGEIRYVRSEAEIVWDGQGRPWRQVGIAQDITERWIAEMQLQESETRFRAVFEQAALGIGLLDLQGCFLSTNKALQEMLGYGEKELQGKLVMELIHADDRKSTLELFRELASGRRESYQMEKRYRRKDGQYLWGRVVASLVQDSEGQPLYAVGVVEDITQRKQTETRLRESEEKLRHLASQLMSAQEDERRRISLVLHDELGQALMLFKFQLSALRDNLRKVKSVAANDCLDILQYLDGLINKVRQLSRDLNPPNILEEQGFQSALKHLIKEFRKFYRIQPGKMAIDEIKLLFARDALISIYRIFQECLINIGRHARASQISIEVKKQEDQVSFMIQDNGRGFDMEKVMGQKALKPGLGIPSLQERVRIMGGSINIWSEPGKGTRISFILPIKIG